MGQTGLMAEEKEDADKWVKELTGHNPFFSDVLNLEHKRGRPPPFCGQRALNLSGWDGEIK